MLSRIRALLRSILRRGRLDREMRDEMRQHLERSTARLIARGMSAEDARRAALREFGNVDYLQEQARDARGARWVESLLADLRFGARHLARTPITTATMVLLLALGIGLNSALYTLFYSIGTMPSPGIPRDQALVRIRGIDAGALQGLTIGREFSYPEFREHVAQQSLFSAVTAWTSADVVLGTDADDQNLQSGAVTYVTANYFQVLGVRPQLGVGLPVDSDDRGPPELAAVISHVVWERHFGRAPDVVGRTVRVNDATVTVVGVAPRGFIGTRSGGSQVRVWMPLNARPLVQRTNAELLASYDSAAFGLAARLLPGVEASAANPTVAAIAARAALRVSAGPPRTGLSADVVEMTANNYFPPSGEAPSAVGRLTTLLIPFLLLLIPCTNVSALLVGLAAARSREIGVRLSLGAARARIVRQLITESVLLALSAGALGLAVIWILTNVLAARFPDVQLVVHWQAALFTFAVAIATGVLFGTSPALHATRAGVSDVLKASAASNSPRSRLQGALVVTQMALTQPLLVGLGALTLTVLSDVRQLPVLESGDRIARLAFQMGARNTSMSEPEREALLGGLRLRLAALPGVEGVVAQGTLEDYVQVSVHSSDRADGVQHAETFWLRTNAAPPGYFALMGFPLIRGRDFGPADLDGGGALVIRGDMARRLWGDADPVGRRLVRAGGTDSTPFVVVGVVDERVAGPSSAREERAFVASLNRTWSLLVRTRGPADPMIPELRAVANAEVPVLPVTSATTLAAAEAVERSQLRRAIAGALGGGLVALLLSAIGLYAIVAFAVGQRTGEIGIRTALGADRRQVVRLFFGRGLRLSLTGVALGLAMSVLVVRLGSITVGRQTDGAIWWVAALIAVVVIAVASLATWIPARRAARIDPLTMLRAE